MIENKTTVEEKPANPVSVKECEQPAAVGVDAPGQAVSVASPPPTAVGPCNGPQHAVADDDGMKHADGCAADKKNGESSAAKVAALVTPGTPVASC